MKFSSVVLLPDRPARLQIELVTASNPDGSSSNQEGLDHAERLTFQERVLNLSIDTRKRNSVRGV